MSAAQYDECITRLKKAGASHGPSGARSCPVQSAAMASESQRLSMIRSYTPADLLTLGNASCGTISIFLCLGYIADDRSGEIRAAFILPIVALALDVLDGYVARLDPRRR